jgi:formylglycine-generating enzyme required for sulfatase activity
LLARYQQHRRYAAEDWGTFDLELEPFNWDTARQAPVPLSADERSGLRLASTLFHAATSRELDDPYEAAELERGTPTWREAPGTHLVALTERVKARSGAAMLVISSRGGQCAPSVVFLKGLPGYSESFKHGPVPIHLRIPTCQASAEGMVGIPAGDFDRNTARGEDGRTSLAAFQIDRTEVTREAFAVYGALEPLTGDGSTAEPGSHDQRLARLPVVGIDHVTARAYCRYMGKDLPTANQWQKAFRGGLSVDGRENPAPRRQTPWQPWSGWLGWLPWLNDVPHHPANLAYDGNEDAAPVGSFPVDTSPYGVVDLAGNVSEWSHTPAEKPEYKGLQAVLGANWDTKPGTNLLRRNLRHPRYLDFVIGVRCVASPRQVTPAQP